jgi:membrane protein CcdC involved in cytochrome C biogenesis
VTIQYQLTLEDYMEASEAVSVHRAKKKPQRARTAGIIVGVIYMLAVVLLTYPWLEPQSWPILLNFMLPIFLMISVLLLTIGIQDVRTRRVPGSRWKGIFLILIAFLQLGPLALILSEPLPSLELRAATNQHSWQLFIPHITWMALLAVLILAGQSNLKKRRKRFWDEKSSSRRAKTAEITAEAMVVSDPVTRFEYQWWAFVDWQETKNLFLLHASQQGTVCIPKRAFASSEELDAMRALAARISVSRSAFPVQPVGSSLAATE